MNKSNNCPACGKLTIQNDKSVYDNKKRYFHLSCAEMVLGCEPDRMIHDCGFLVKMDDPICLNCAKEVSFDLGLRK